VDARVQEDSGLRQYVTLFDAEDGSSKALYSGDEGHIVLVSVSPTRPMGALFYAGAAPQGQQQMLLVAFDADGETGRASGTPITNVGLLMSGFGPTGDGPYAFDFPMPTAGAPVTKRAFALTPGSDQLHEVQLDAMPQQPAISESDDLRLIVDKKDEYGRSRVSLGVGKDKQSSVFIGGDAVGASLAPMGTAVAYKHADELVVREILRFPIARWRSLAQGYYEDRIRGMVSSTEGMVRGYQNGDQTRSPTSLVGIRYLRPFDPTLS